MGIDFGTTHMHMNMYKLHIAYMVRCFFIIGIGEADPSLDSVTSCVNLF